MAKTPDPDAALMLRAKGGDTRAFEELVEKYKQPIVNLMYRMLHDLSEAEDLAQAVFLKVYQSAGRYEVSAKFSTWIFTIARHVCLNEIRRRSRHPSESIEASVEGEEATARQFEDMKTFTPPEAYLQGELEGKIQEALDALPEKQRLAVLLCRQDELSYEEIAKVLEIFAFGNEVTYPPGAGDVEGAVEAVFANRRVGGRGARNLKSEEVFMSNVSEDQIDDFDGLKSEVWRRRLTVDEQARLQKHLAIRPEAKGAWENEMALTKALLGLPPARVSSNFTALVMEAARKGSQRHGWWGEWEWSDWLPMGWRSRLALGSAMVCLSLLTIKEYRLAERHRMVHELASVGSLASAQPVDWLTNFDAIQSLSRVEVADNELLQVLQ